MIKVLLCGACGKMGKVIAKIIDSTPGLFIAAGIDPSKDYSDNFPIFEKPEDFDGAADVIIDFSHPNALKGIVSLAVRNQTPIVVATTGLSDEQVSFLHESAKEIPVFYTANMSLGINLMVNLIKKAASVLEGFDIEIIDKHHNQKIDAPSGTALMLANEMKKVLPYNAENVYDRHDKLAKRKTTEIGFHAIRGGTIVGDHQVIFAGKDEVFEISHSAASKEVFAQGAVRAAKYIVTKTPGLYNMANLVEEVT